MTATSEAVGSRRPGRGTGFQPVRATCGVRERRRPNLPATPHGLETRATRGGLVNRLLTLVLAAGAFAAAVTAAGCAVDQAKEVALYRQILDGPSTRPAVAYAPGDPLSLSDALLLANQHNEQLAVSGENYVQALIDKDRAASAFLPTIALVPSYSQAQAADDGGARRLTGGNTADPVELQSRSSLSSGRGNWDTPVNANWNVFRGFRDLANLNRSASEIGRLKAALLDLKAAVLLDVASTYYNVLRSESTVRVLESSSQIQDARVGEMRARDRVGSARKLDVAQAEAQAANTRAQLAGARADVQNARALLAFLAGAPVREAPLVDRLTVPDSAEDLDAALSRAQSGRQDLTAARAATQSATLAVQSAVRQYYPSISLNFNYYLSRMTQPDGSLWNGLVSFNFPIFTGGRIRADVRTAWSQFRQSVAQEQYLKRQVEQEARTSVENLRASGQRLAELRVAVEAAQQALDVAEGNYRAGSGIYLERLVAQDQLLSAQLQLTSEAYNRKLNYLNLLRVTGELRDPPPEGPAAGPATGALNATAPATRQATVPATSPAP
jgi:outer membrane protein TolC